MKETFLFLLLLKLLLLLESFRFEDEKECKFKFNLQFLARSQKKRSPRKASFYFFSPKKLVWLFMLKEVKLSPNGKMIKLLPQEAEERLLGIIYKTDRYFETLKASYIR